MPLTYTAERLEQLRQKLNAVRLVIERASSDTSGARDISSPLPELVVVTKFFPASDLAALYDLGVRRVGENRDQEAGAKAQELEAYTGLDDPLRWAFIGQLQTNKAKSVVQYATEVQSIDRPQLVKALSKAYLNRVAQYEQKLGPAPASMHQGGLRCFIQVNLDESGIVTAGQAAQGYRGGAAPDDVLALADLVSDMPGLTLAGLMAVAPLGQDPFKAFERLYRSSQKLQEQHPQAAEISAGMSHDLEAAIYWGSTTVRVGSQIMGSRPRA